MISRIRLAFAVVSLATSVAVARDAAAAAGRAPASVGVELRLEAPTILSDDEFMWTMKFVFMNTGGTGLYSDSLLCEVEYLDPGLPSHARHATLRLSSAARLAATVSAGESLRFEVRVPPTGERAKLAFRYFGHRSSGAAVTTSFTATAEPGSAALSLPSEFVTAGAHKVEFVRLMAGGDSLGPAVLYVPADDRGARSVFRPLRALLARGINVVAVSLPGRGLSEGIDDDAANVAAVSRVFDEMHHMSGLDSTRIALWGVQRGAAVAALAAAQRDARALICEAGCYDSSSCGRAANPAVRRLRVPTLVLHGESDTTAPVPQAHAFAAALKAAGAEVSETVLPSLGHDLHGASLRPSVDFLLRQFRP